jgi:hypothetical protein
MSQMLGYLPIQGYPTPLPPSLGTSPLNGGIGATQQVLMMQTLLGMMMQIVQSGGSLFGLPSSGGGMLPAQAGFGGGQAARESGALANFLGDSPASNQGVGSQRKPPRTSKAARAASGEKTGTDDGPAKIGRGTRVLEIGDSHSVGTFGQELDRRLRGTGARVSTYASAGADASDFVNGTPNKYGYWEKRANGQEKSVGYGRQAAPPKFEQLLDREKPDVIVVNLGANFRSGNPKAEVDKIGRIAKKHGIPLVWVGPPKTAKDNGNPASIKAFDRKMKAAVAPYGEYIASSKHTDRYAGGDGLHYSGAEGTRIAKQWAKGVFQAITG